MAWLINLSLILLFEIFLFPSGFCILVLFFKADREAASGLIVSAAAFLLFFRCLVVFLENKIPNPAL